MGGFISYTGEKSIVIDSLSPNSIPYGTLCKLLDNNPLKLNAKGLFINYDAENVYITSIRPPQDFELNKNDILGRLNKVVHFRVYKDYYEYDNIDMYKKEINGADNKSIY